MSAIEAILERFHGEHYELGLKLDQVLANQVKIMAAQDDINAAVTAIDAAVTTLASEPAPVDTTALVAATAMSGRTSIDRAGRWVIISVFGYGLCMIGFGVSHVFVLSMLMLAGTGAGNMVGAVLRGTSNQLLTPDALRGRVAAVNAVFVTGGPQLGQFESGAVAELWSPQVSAFTGGMAAVLIVPCLLLVPALRQFHLGRATAETSAAEPVRVA